MATFFSTLSTAFYTTPTAGGPTYWQLPGVINTPVRCYVDSYTALGTEVAGSIIRFFTDGINQTLPIGANILYMEFIASAATTSLTGSVGDLSLATRYIATSTLFATATTLVRVPGVVFGTNGNGGVNGAGAGNAPYIIGTNASTAAAGVVTNGDNQIILTTAGATLASGTIISAVLYFTLTA